MPILRAHSRASDAAVVSFPPITEIKLRRAVVGVVVQEMTARHGGRLVRSASSAADALRRMRT